MLLLILFVLFFIVLQNRTSKITTEELIQNYEANRIEADKQFLGKTLEISGRVKSFLQFESDKSLLELKTANDELRLYCILMNKETEDIASILTTGTSVTVYGKCLGMADLKFHNSLCIEAERIK